MNEASGLYQAGSEVIRFKPGLPPGDGGGIATDRRGDPGEGLALGQHQNDLRTARTFRANSPTAGPPFQFGAFISGESERHMAQYSTTGSVVTVH